MRSIRVAGSGFRPYEVLVAEGLIAGAGARIHSLTSHGRAFVVADANVHALHGEALAHSLESAGVAQAAVVIAPGESSKSFEGLQDLCDRLLDLKAGRGDLLIAFGGGVVGDLTGFVAAILKRGMDFVQIPTTLLAQVDSSVGGKTAIDTRHGKNLVGAFWQPRLVLCDLALLATLPARELRSGFAEVIKYGLLGDRAFFQRLERESSAILQREPEPLAHAVARCIEMKAQIVADDEREQGRRALLNLGHTFGHALEAETGFSDALSHGEAVALGCVIAFRFSAGLGLCAGDEARRAQAAIGAVGLPASLESLDRRFSAERLIGHMLQDKKARSGALTFILAHAIGEAFVAHDVPADAVRAHLISEGALP